MRHQKSEEAIAQSIPLRRRLNKLIHSHTFDHVMGAVIILNMVLIIVETDHAAKHDDSVEWLVTCGWCILVVFVVELIIRLFVLHREFFKDGWNTFDFFIVVTDAIFSVLGLLFEDIFPISTLRVFRLCKLARVSKVFRVFPELRIMMAGLLGSFRAIFWGTVLLAFILLVWSILAVQFIHPLNTELAAQGYFDQLGCERCPRAYSSVMQSTLTFTQQIVAGDSWGTATIPLIENYPVTVVYFMGVFLSVGFAVMNLILGVVVNVAQSEHDRLKGEIEDETGLLKMEGRDNLLNICADMDADGSGELSKEEIQNGYREREDFREAIAYLDLKEEDMAIAFADIDTDRSGAVAYTEFVKKIYKLKDTDGVFLLEQIKYNVCQVKEFIVTLMNQQHTELMDFEKSKMSAIERIEEKEEVLMAQSQLQSPKLQANGSQQTNIKVTAASSWDNARQPSVLPPNEPGTLEPKDHSAATQMNSEVVDALLTVSTLFQDDFRESLRHIEKSLERQTSNISALLSELMPRRPADEVKSCCKG